MTTSDDLTSRAESLAELADLVLHVARRISGHRFEDRRIVRLSQLESLALRHIDRQHGLSSSQLATDLGLRSSNASAVVRSLEAKQLITRTPDPEDRRAVRLHPTEVARENIRYVRGEWATLLEGALPRDASPSTAIEVLRQLERGLEETAGTDQGPGRPA